MNPIVELTGSREKPKGVKVLATPTLIMNGPASGFITSESLRYCAGDTGTDLSIWVTDGTTDWYLLNSAPIAANASVVIEDHIVLPTGWSLKAQAVDANRIDIILVPVVSGQGGTTTQ